MGSSEVLDTTCYFLSLVGGVRLQDPDGHDVTPKSDRARALLGILAISDGGWVPRSVLQSRLWSDRMDKQGRDSLRQALSEIRRAVGSDANAVLLTEGQQVSLNKELVRWDFESNPATVSDGKFMQGLRISDPEFRRWLISTRARLRAGLEANKRFQEQSTDQYTDFLTSPSFVLEVSYVKSDEGIAALASHAIIDDVSRNLKELLSVRVFDASVPRADNLSLAEEAIVLKLQLASLVEYKDKLRIFIRISDSASSRHIWSFSKELSVSRAFDSASLDRSELISLVTEKLILEFREGDKIVGLPGAPYQLLDLFFSEAVGNPNVENYLKLVQQQSNDPVFKALSAYYETLKVGEGHLLADKEIQEFALCQVHTSLDHGKFDSTYLSAAGYALHYLTGSSELSASLLFKSTELGFGQPMCWDHLALYFYDNGEFERARAASDRSLLVSEYSKFRFAFETTRAMVAHAEGDYSSAILFGNRALERNPTYSAALRYTASSLALAGRLGEAEEVGRELIEHFPDFRANIQTQGMLNSASKDAKARLTRGLLMAGLPA